MDMNIVLTGFMATGKTAVGKLLAEELNMQFVGTDELIEAESKMKISDIFDKKGEPYFRDLETSIIKKVSTQDNCVIAVGGGAVLRSENMNALEQNGKIVCLTAEPETIYNRIKGDITRPLLKVADPLARIKELLKLRESYYQRCHHSVDTSLRTEKKVANEIIKLISLDKSREE